MEKCISWWLKLSYINIYVCVRMCFLMYTSAHISLVHFWAYKDNEPLMSTALWRLCPSYQGALWPAGGLHGQRDEKQLSATCQSGTDGAF